MGKKAKTLISGLAAFTVGITALSVIPESSVMNVNAQEEAVKGSASEQTENDSADSVNQTAATMDVRDNTIRVGWYESSCFQEGMSDDEAKSGYAYEYYARIADYTGWEYEYVYGDWAELLDKLECGEIDVLAGVSETEERKEYMLFPNDELGTDCYYIYQHADDQSMDENEPSSFDGKKIGGVTDNRMTVYLEQWLTEKNVSAQIVYYDGLTERDEAFAAGEIDGIVATENNIKSNSNYAPVAKVGEEPFYVAVAKNRPDILAEINSVHSTLSSLSPGFLDVLQLKCYGQTLTNSTLTKAEGSWIENHGTLKVGYAADYMPFCGDDGDGNAIGLVADITPMIFKNVNLDKEVKFEYIRFDSFKDMSDSIAAGNIDLCFPIINDRNILERMGITGTSDIITVPFYVAYKGDYTDDTFDRIVLNTRTLDEITKNYPDSEIITTATADESLQMILDDEATCTLMASYRLKYLLNDSKYSEIITMPSGINMTYCYGVGKDSKELLSILNKGISQLESARVTDCALKYIQAERQYTFKDFIKDNLIPAFVLGVVIFALVILCLSLYLGSARKEKKMIELQLENVSILAALSQEYEAIHVADLDADTFSTLRTSRGMEEMSVSTETDSYSTKTVDMINTFVMPEAREAFLEYVNIDRMKERMEKESKFTYRYPIVSDIFGAYIYEMTFAKIGEDPYRHLLVIGTKCIDDVLKLERKEGLYNAALLQEAAYFYEFDVTEGLIDGEFNCRGGYDPLFGLKPQFPMPYDRFNSMRASNFGLSANSEEEARFWTCAGLKGAFESGRKTVGIRYYSEDIGLYGDATIILTEEGTSHHLHAVYICKDVTERVEADLKGKRELERALQDAEAANNAKTSFLFNMSHDIRTPMNAIIGFRALLEKYQDDPVKREDYLKKIENASDVLLSIINNVLEMARIEKGTIDIDSVPWSIIQMGDTMSNVFQEMMAEKNLEFTKEIHVTHEYVMCDPIKLREIFINIISNACKYTEPGGKIKLLVEELPGRTEDEVCMRTTISDTGIGMSEDFLPHLYEEFSREYNTTDRKIEGTGLGMPIVKRLVEHMQGTIEVSSTLGVGTTFVVVIPHKIAETSEQTEDETVEVDEKIFEGKRILIAEDNDLNAEIAMEILSEMGFLVERANDGDVCVDMLKNSEDGYYDLILMDIQMPRMNGYDAAHAIRGLRDNTKACIPILAMTANAFEEDKKKALSSGMNGHVAKPVDIDMLKVELSKALGGRN